MMDRKKFSNSSPLFEKLLSETGYYMLLFDAVYDAIVNDKDYFAKQNDILTQLSILEK